MLNFKDLGDMTKLASQARELQKQQDERQKQQIEALSRIEHLLEQMLTELKKINHP